MSLRAWRFWRVIEVAPGYPQLWSTFVQGAWQGPVLHAHQVPTLTDDSQPARGIFALRAVTPHFEYSIQPAPFGLLRGLVGGYVQLWGRVVIHAQGLRAEHAMIEALTAHITLAEGLAPRVGEELLARLQAHYGVDLFDLTTPALPLLVREPTTFQHGDLR